MNQWRDPSESVSVYYASNFAAIAVKQVVGVEYMYSLF